VIQPLEELGKAILKTRTAYGESQEAFARRVNCALMTLSRFERGVVPKNHRILAGLAQAASQKGLDREAQLFLTAALRDVQPAIELVYGPRWPAV
jgi:transcriptional regulator with XRE-family HTH domain